MTTPMPPGGYTTVITTVTVTSAGAVVPVIIDGIHVNVDVPAGTFPVGESVKLTVTAPHLPAITPTPGFTVVAGAGIQIMLNGAPYPGVFLRPITLTFTSPNITASSVVLVWNGSSFVTDPSSTAMAGSASVSFDSDPDFAVESPTTPKAAPVPGATHPVTGKPFLGEGILAGLLLLSGTGGVVMSRRRRGKAAPAEQLQRLPARGRPGVSRRGCPGPPSVTRVSKRRQRAWRRSRCTDRERGLAWQA